MDKRKNDEGVSLWGAFRMVAQLLVYLVVGYLLVVCLCVLCMVIGSFVGSEGRCIGGFNECFYELPKPEP